MPGLSPAGLARVMLGVLAVSAAVLVRCALGALRLEPLPVPSVANADHAIRQADARSGRLPEKAVAAAVDADPFQPERSRPEVAYRLAHAADPGPEPRAQPEIQSPAPPPRPPFVLVGTTVMPEGKGLAVLGRAGQPPRVVRRGEVVDGMRVERIGRGSVVLVSADSTVVLSLRRSSVE